MKNALQQTAEHSPEAYIRLLLYFASYRQEMTVRELVIFSSGHRKHGYYRCPRCLATMEREFTQYCDRCGQHLNWKGYKKAKIVYPGQQNTEHI